MWNFGLKFIYAPWVKYGFQRADFHKTHSHSTIFVYFLYDIFSRFCKVVKKSTSKSHFRSNVAVTAQNLTILGLGKRKYVKVSYAEVKDSTRRYLFPPLHKVWLSPRWTARNSRCCTNFCRNFYMIFHVMSPLCYFFKKKMLLYNTCSEHWQIFFIITLCRCWRWLAQIERHVYLILHTVSAIQNSVWHLITSGASKGSSHRLVLSKY